MTMTRRLTAISLAGALFLFAHQPASAHFQLVYTPEVNLEAPGDVPVKLIFWHPFENGHVMDMATPIAFYAVQRGETIDLLDSLEPFAFEGAEGAGTAYLGSVPVRRSGDYVLVVVPAPYYEEAEDIYIQQITKSYLVRNEIPTDWTEPQGLVTEIVPKNRPTNVIAGSTFTGCVLANGEPVAGAELEIEYMAAEPIMDERRASDPTAAPMPGGAVVALADADGCFTFGIPRAGFWGFAALGSGPETEHEGKELSQDAVLWIRAYDME